MGLRQKRHEIATHVHPQDRRNPIVIILRKLFFFFFAQIVIVERVRTVRSGSKPWACARGGPSTCYTYRKPGGTFLSRNFNNKITIFYDNN